jgi:hypothetical protein
MLIQVQLIVIENSSVNETDQVINHFSMFNFDSR